MSFQTTLPAWYTQFFGHPVGYEFVLDQRKVSPPGQTCLNRLRIARLTKGLPDSICISKHETLDLRDGDHVLLKGTQTVLGFQFSLQPEHVERLQPNE